MSRVKGVIVMGRMRKSFVYRKLASTKTVVFLLFALVFFYLIGTVFPQGVHVKEYEEAGGKFLFAAEYFGVLHIFRTPLFFFTGLLLALSALVCTLERFLSLPSKKNSASSSHSLWKSSRYQGLNEGDYGDLGGIIDKLEDRGYSRKIVAFRENSVNFSLSRGFDTKYFSILYHGGICIAIFAFFHTHFYAYENDITLFPEETVNITLGSGKTAPFKLKLNEFKTLYVENPRFKFPRGALKRVSAIVSKGTEKPAFHVDGKSLFVTDWVSDLSVVENSREVKRSKIEVNHPLKYRGFTFYQMGYLQEVTLLINGKEVISEPRKPFPMGKKGDTYVLSTLRHGRLKTLSGEEKEVVPTFTLYREKDLSKGRKIRGKGVEVSIGEEKDVWGNKVSFLRMKEGTILSYRVDPAAKLLYWVSFLVFILIMGSLYLGRSSLSIIVAKGPEGPTGTFTFRGRGLLFSARRESNNVRKIIEEGGITPR